MISSFDKCGWCGTHCYGSDISLYDENTENSFCSEICYENWEEHNIFFITDWYREKYVE